MSSAPVVPTSPVSTIARDWNFITHHLISVALVVLLAVGGIYGVESLIAKHDAATSSKYDAILAAQAQQNKVNEAHYAQVEAQLMAQNALFATAITARNQQVVAQKQVDATLSAQDAAARLAQQTKAAPGEVVATNNAISVDLPVTRMIVAALDELPVAQANLADTQQQLVNETTVADNFKLDVAGLRAQLTDANKACTAKVALVNAQARKGKLKWFGIGYVAGFISARLLGV